MARTTQTCTRTRSTDTKSNKTTKNKPTQAPKSTTKAQKKNNLPSDDEDVSPQVTKTKTNKQKKQNIQPVKAKVVDKAATKKKDTKATKKTTNSKAIKVTASSAKDSKKVTKKTKKNAKDDDDEMEVDEVVNNIVVIEKNGAVVDEYVPNARQYCVTKDKDGSFGYKHLTATLNKCDVKNNNNKFYKLQVLIHETSIQHFLFKRWGRNGYPGVNELTVKYFLN
jgi:hypothetical protein